MSGLVNHRSNQQKMSVSLNDIIELDPEITLRGAGINRLAKVIEVKKNHIEALDLSKNSRVIIPIDYLYEKQELIGVRLKPIEEKQLAAMGAKSLWVKLTPRQHTKYKSKHKENDSNLTIPREPEIDDDQIKFLKNWFMIAKTEDDKQERKQQQQDQQTLNMFKSKPEEKISILGKPIPLSRFIRKKNE